MLGVQRASGMVRGPRGCLVNEVNLRIACRSSMPPRATTAISNRFVAGCDWDNEQHRRMAWSAFRSLGRLGGGSSVT
jgi:hypothetical protein